MTPHDGHPKITKLLKLTATAAAKLSSFPPANIASYSHRGINPASGRAHYLGRHSTSPAGSGPFPNGRRQPKVGVQGSVLQITKTVRLQFVLHRRMSEPGFINFELFLRTVDWGRLGRISMHKEYSIAG